METFQYDRSIEELLVDALLEEALGGKNRAAAIGEIFDRIEGKSRQQLEVTSTTTPYSDRTYDDLHFYSVSGLWPEAAIAARALPEELLLKAEKPLGQLDSILQ